MLYASYALIAMALSTANVSILGFLVILALVFAVQFYRLNTLMVLLFSALTALNLAVFGITITDIEFYVVIICMNLIYIFSLEK